ncbi:MAG: DUF58 domain-containing protein [Spirochaetota bacterium]|jgi:uncharacterized protein (DUF58 family)|nr:DUF58 domain-containing protein [Spirochaetota bacterium]
MQGSVQRERAERGGADNERMRELLARVRSIEIRSRRLADTVLTGQYRTAFRGSGIEFEEVREYISGDEVRSIDWNVTARTGRLFVKKYREERERNVVMLIDISASQYFNTRNKSKNELCAELAAVFALSALSSKDKIGLILFSDRIEKTIMPRRGRSHVLRVIREVLACEPKGKATDIQLALGHANRVLPHRSIVLVLSDFFQNPEEYEKALIYTTLRHDFVPIIIRDPFEESAPPSGVLVVADAETDDLVPVALSSKAARAEYAEHSRQIDAGLKVFLRRHRIDSITVRTGSEYISELAQFFRRRVARQ